MCVGEWGGGSIPRLSKNLDPIILDFWFQRPRELLGVQGLERPGTEKNGCVVAYDEEVPCSCRLSFQEGLYLALYSGCEPLSFLVWVW